MAVGTKLLYVTATDAETTSGIRAISFNPDSASFKSTGDNAMTFYPGRVRYAGTIVVEDVTAATALLLAVAATTTFDTVSDDDAARITLTGWMATSRAQDVGDGTVDGDVPGITLNWVATGLSVGAVV